MKQQKQQTIWSQFIPLVSIFFFWGFVAASNDILIPVFKKNFTLSQFQSMLVNNAFYAAYFVGAVVFFLVSMKQDVLQMFGYKRTLSLGLCISALGAFLFVPAAHMSSYWLFLVALFVVGLGFSVQQIVANPLAIKMGSEGTGAYRLTMAGGVNSLGTTIGPVVLGIAFFGVEPSKDTSLNLDDVKFPFVILGITFILVALFLMMSKIENPDKKETKEPQEKFNVFQYPQLLLGMLAIFLYVGVEVSIVSNLPALLHTDDFGNILEENLAPFISLYWGSLMIGRWSGGVNVLDCSKKTNILLKCLMPFIAFGVIVIVNVLSGKDISSFFVYPIWVLIFIITSFLGEKTAGQTLMVFGVVGMLMMVGGLVYPNPEIAKYFFISGGLFCSIMWPAIFDLAISGLGKNTGKASSFLIMMILGGGIVPLIQGKICDFSMEYPEGIWGISYVHFSYIVPLLCFVYLAFYGYIAPKIIRREE